MFLIKKTRSNTQHTSFAIFVSARQKKEITDGQMDRRTDGQTARSCYKVEAHD